MRGSVYLHLFFNLNLFRGPAKPVYSYLICSIRAHRHATMYTGAAPSWVMALRRLKRTCISIANMGKQVITDKGLTRDAAREPGD